MGKKVLLIEEHDSFRHFLGTYLAQQFEVFGAADEIDAMTTLHQGLLPDAIIASARLAGKNASQLLTALRYSGLFADIPVVIIGDNNLESERERFTMAGASAYFCKPFNPVLLHEHIVRVAAG